MLTLNSPYPYKEFKRKSVNGKRLYENPFGDPVPSVTTILDKTKPRENVKHLLIGKSVSAKRKHKKL